MKRVPVFPLPNVVFFPKTLLPLHIFEPRYRQMVTHCLALDQRMAVALLKPGWKEDYHAKPDFHAVATVGKIVEHEELPDGRFNLVLEGLERVQLEEEGTADLAANEEAILYRRALAIPFPEKNTTAGTEDQKIIQVRLTQVADDLLEAMGSKEDSASFRAEIPFEAYVNRIAATFDLPQEVKQSLLEIDDLVARAHSLEAALRERILFWKAVSEFRKLAPEDPRMN
jgi:Lon protease-like protein